MFKMGLVNDGIEYTNPRRRGDGLDLGSYKKYYVKFYLLNNLGLLLFCQRSIGVCFANHQYVREDLGRSERSI